MRRRSITSPSLHKMFSQELPNKRNSRCHHSPDDGVQLSNLCDSVPTPGTAGHRTDPTFRVNSLRASRLELHSCEACFSFEATDSYKLPSAPVAGAGGSADVHSRMSQQSG